MPIVPMMESRIEISYFTNKFNPDRNVPQLTLFSDEGNLIQTNALTELINLRNVEEISSTFRYWEQ